ncbi:MAG: dihydropteroate synthase [Deltaproteobacteria bacterium]|nr:dihydropteroate synthase [Deltaproteobacteria bacterium]
MAQLADLSVGDLAPVRVMAVLNVSPESFYPGSVRIDLAQLAAAARVMASAGADIIDVGAMSTAPYLKTQISEDEETDRLARAVETITTTVALPISADTQRAKPAAAALAAGARIINDVSGLKRDPDMAHLIATSGAGVILMASEVTPASGEPIQRIQATLQESLRLAAQAQIPADRIVLDPGVGFFRQPGVSWYDWDCIVLRELAALRTLGFALLIGASRKSFIGKILDQPEAADRLSGSLACAAIAVNNGAHIIRAHDVKETVDTVRMAERLRPTYFSAATE